MLIENGVKQTWLAVIKILFSCYKSILKDIKAHRQQCEHARTFPMNKLTHTTLALSYQMKYCGNNHIVIYSQTARGESWGQMKQNMKVSTMEKSNRIPRFGR